MALSREGYEALEAIVGPENISEDPVILDGYAFQMMAGGLEERFGGRFLTRPEAVLLPGSAEEVQRVVKICNKYKIHFKPHGTGWGFWGGPTTKGVIQLDLRRMNRILEINEKNMYAVVEPYVSSMHIQAEAQKKGLNPHIIPCCSGSVLATATSAWGYGSSGLYTGYSGRNVLGVEWVLPTGEILRLGSIGSGSGWFCGDGPGPSLRGVMRGFKGAAGGLGVFTKVAVKLYAWPGPPVMPIDGKAPHYTTPLPDNFKAYVVTFPDFKRFGDFWIKIGEAEIGYTTHKLLSTLRDAALYMLSKLPGKTKDDIEEVMKMPETHALFKETKHSCRLILVGHSPRHVEYQEKVLKEILAETEGHIVSFFEEPRMRNALLISELKHSSANEVFDFSGEWTTSFGFLETADLSGERIKVGEVLKRKTLDEAKGLLMEPAEDMASSLYEGGGIGAEHEEIAYYDPADHQSAKAGAEYGLAALDLVASKGWPIGLDYSNVIMVGEAIQPEERKYLTHPRVANYFHWQAKIKHAMDPNSASDPGTYFTIEDDEMNRISSQHIDEKKKDSKNKKK